MFLSVSDKEKEEKSEEVKYAKQELNSFERFHARMPILEGLAWYQSLLGIQSVITNPYAQKVIPDMNQHKSKCRRQAFSKKNLLIFTCLVQKEVGSTLLKC